MLWCINCTNSNAYLRKNSTRSSSTASSAYWPEHVWGTACSTNPRISSVIRSKCSCPFVSCPTAVGIRGLCRFSLARRYLRLMVALWLYVRKYKVNLLRVLDNIAIATPICACFIRLGNLMNSEIVGKFTGSDYGFVFVQNGDTLPRHPGQLYEAVAYLLFFIVGLWLYRRFKQRVGTGFYFATASPPSLPSASLSSSARKCRNLGAGHAAKHRTEPGTAVEHPLRAARHLLPFGRQIL